MPKNSSEIPQKMMDQLTRLKNDKVRLHELIASFSEEIQKLQLKSMTTESEELSAIFGQGSRVVKDAQKTLMDYLKELDGEIARVEAAHAGFVLDDITQIKEAYMQFILSDVSFSIKNVAMTFYDYDRILDDIRALHRERD